MVRKQEQLTKAGTVDARPDPKDRKHPQLWQAYLAWHEMMETRKRHVLRKSSAERGKSNLDPEFEDYLMDLLRLDVLVNPKNKAERAVSAKQIMINYGEAVGPIWDWCLSQKGLGEGLTAQLLARIDDVNAFATVSKLWRFAGYGLYLYWLDEAGRVQAPRFGNQWRSVKGEKVKVPTVVVGPEEVGEALYWLGHYGGIEADSASEVEAWRDALLTVVGQHPYMPKLRHYGKTVGRVVARFGAADRPLICGATLAAIRRHRNARGRLAWPEAVAQITPAEVVSIPIDPPRLEVGQAGWRLDRHRDVKVKGFHSPYDAQLKAVCYNIAEQFIRQQSSPWVDLYYAEKARQRELHPEVVKANGRTQFNDGHLHFRAWRKMIKEFLKELWAIWKENSDSDQSQGGRL